MRTKSTAAPLSIATALLTGFLWFNLTCPAPAAVIFDNFDSGGGFDPQSYFTAAGFTFNLGTNGVRAAARFGVTGGSWNLSSVTLPIAFQGSSGNYLRVRIAADSGGVPGTTLEVLSEDQSIWPAFSNPFTTTTTLSSGAQPLLMDGANYWLIAEPAFVPSGQDSSQFLWFYNTSGVTVSALQQPGSGLPSDPWPASTISVALAFRVEGATNPCPAQSLPLSNTGVDASGQVLAGGSPEAHFNLTDSRVVGASNAMVVAPTAPGWFTNGTASAWIGPPTNGIGPFGSYLYQMSFDLSCTDNVAITGQWMVDNDGAIYVNTSPTPAVTLTGGSSDNFTAWHPFTLASGWIMGRNTLYFYVTNQTYGYTGLRVEMSGTSHCCCPQTAGLFDSGVDTNGAPLPPQGLDSHFVLLVNPDNTGTQPYVVDPPSPSWLPNSATSQWISSEPDGEGIEDGVYQYRLSFMLPCTNDAYVSGEWAVDNDGAIVLNGNPTPVAALSGGVPENYNTWHPFALTGGFVSGANTLDFFVTNGILQTGLRVEVSGGANCCCPTVGTVRLNTGLDQSSGLTYPLGQADAFWRVVQDPTVPHGTLPRPATVIGLNERWQSAQPNSQWISSYPSDVDNLNGTYVFATDFCLTQGATNVVLNICLRADDSASAFLNGNAISLSPADTSYGAASAACGSASMAIDPGWFVAGKNTLTIYVTNSGSVAMGLNLTGTVTGQGLIDPESACCHPSSGISGQKFLDLNGNGVRDPGEPGLAGWTLHLSNGNEAVTDLNGYYYFQGLDPGLYSLTEEQQPGWTQTAPSGGTAVVSLGSAQQVNGVDFANSHPNQLGCIQIQCPSNLVVYAVGSAVVNYTVTASDACSTNLPTVYCEPASHGFFPLGVTTVNCTAYDQLGNSTTCSFTVTVIDPTPVFNYCPASTNLGCNPASIPGCDPNVTATDSCVTLSSAYLFVREFGSKTVWRFDGTSGALIDTFVPAGADDLHAAGPMFFGPDGNLYITTSTGLNRYDPATGAFLATLIPANQLDSTPIAFGPDQNVYGCNYYENKVVRYDGVTGAPLGDFASGAGLAYPVDLLFGPDVNLYVRDGFDDSVYRYNGTSGAFIDAFISLSVLIDSSEAGMTFGPDGKFYMANSDFGVPAAIRRFNGTTGAFIDIFTSGETVPYTSGTVFGPDGNLYVCNYNTEAVEKHDGTTGAFLGNFVQESDMSQPIQALFSPPVLAAHPAQLSCASVDATNGCQHTRTITYTATSACGATNTCVQVITWTSGAPPAFTSLPAGGDLGCNPATVPTDAGIQNGVQATGPCGVLATNVTHTDTTNGCQAVRTFTVSLNSLCNPPVSTNIVYTWKADAGPPLLSCAVDKTVSCGSAWDFDPPAVTDACSGTNLALAFTTTTNSICPLVLTRTWVATNLCGYSNACQQTVTVQRCAPAPACLISWWPAQGNANDVTGGNNGTLQGNATFAPGEVGQAFSFDGDVSGWVEVPDSASLDISGPLTIEAWVQLHSVVPTPGSDRIIVWRGHDGADVTSPYSLAVGLSNRIDGFIANGSAQNVVSSATLLEVGVWYHIAFTADGSELRLYINGMLDSSLSQSITPAGVPESLVIGGGLGSSANALDGLIDELAIYNCALTPAQIAASYAAGALGKCAGPFLTCPGNKTVQCGTCFAGDNPSAFNVLHTFAVTNTDGANPVTGLIQGTDGFLYGVTASGGASGSGTLFKLGPDGSAYQVLVNFTGTGGAAPGGAPEASLVQGTDSFLYGTTANGGSFGLGTLFLENRAGGNPIVAHHFGGPDGQNPEARLVQDSLDVLYGTTKLGGANGLGVIFSWDADAQIFSTLHSFTSTEAGSTGNGGLTLAGNALYGTSASGGLPGGLGTVFKYDLGSHVLTVLHVFSGAPDGEEPEGDLLLADDGALYGTTRFGGTANLGTVFKVTTGGAYSQVSAFAGADGADILGGLVEGCDGALYGVADGGGAGAGTVFKVNKDGSGSQALWTFSASDNGGSNPRGTLLLGGDRTLYGTTYTGGAAGLGTIFHLVGSVGWNFDPPTLANTCAGMGLTLSATTITNGLCPRTITRTWTAVDPCGVTNTCGQTVTILPTADQVAPVIVSVRYDSAGMHIVTHTQPCNGYALECKDHLLDPSWNTCQTAYGDGTDLEFLDANLQSATRFYRVRRLCP